MDIRRFIVDFVCLFWLHRVSVASHRLSLVEEKGGYSLAVVCGLQTAASVVIVLRLSCSGACGILVSEVK